jgi:hypothetical protein
LQTCFLYVFLPLFTDILIEIM